MASPLDLKSCIVGYQRDSSDEICSIEATVVTGFEEAAQDEIVEKFGIEKESITRCQGRIVFDIPVNETPGLLKLRCVDNLYVLTSLHPQFFTDKSKEENTSQENLEKLVELIHTDLIWKKGLKVWQLCSGYKGKIYPNNTQDDDAATAPSSDVPPEKRSKQSENEENVIPSFRCTCYRSGQNFHNFQSTEVASKVGGAIQDKFGWKVKMKEMDLEIVFNVDLKQVYSGIALNKVSLYKRSVSHFGPTTLRATICSSMLRYAEIKPGDVVVDPMCGGGTIPLEGAAEFGAKAFVIGGDMHAKAVERTKNNIRDYPGPKLNVDAFRWDVMNVPLRDNSVDVFVTDLPFGKRSGSKADNRVLYPKTLLSMARVVRPKGRAVVLTQDKNSMFKCMSKINPYWKTVRHHGANIGGLMALVFIFLRTDTPYINNSKK